MQKNNRFKFRAWDTGEIFNTTIPRMLDNEVVSRSLDAVFLDGDCTVMQFTGVKDVNGVDIYEGDILEFDEREWGDSTSNKGIVRWDNEESWFYAIASAIEWPEFCTVIGNIFENPDMAKSIEKDIFGEKKKYSELTNFLAIFSSRTD